MASAYTVSQIDKYLDYIQIPLRYHRISSPKLDIDFLNVLHTYQISAIPYENLTLHYSRTRDISLDPQHLFVKLMENGRGGYCMENSIFFNHILRALGFRAYTAGVRVRPRVEGLPIGDYGGWRHIVNVVTLENGDKYMVDVGFGGDGAIKPILMVSGTIVQNIGSQQIRIIYDTISQLTDQSQKLWIYQYRNGLDKPWNSFYCFPEIEFLQTDFEVANYFVSKSPESFQTYQMLVVKFLRRNDEVYGKRMLVDGIVKENLGGKTVVLKTCITEPERIDALKQYFGIGLTKEERDGIQGHSTELKAA